MADAARRRDRGVIDDGIAVSGRGGGGASGTGSAARPRDGGVALGETPPVPSETPPALPPASPPPLPRPRLTGG